MLNEKRRQMTPDILVAELYEKTMNGEIEWSFFAESYY
jgi:hypothetical protein